MDRTAPKRKKSATQGKKSSLKGMSGTKKKHKIDKSRSSKKSFQVPASISKKQNSTLIDESL